MPSIPSHLTFFWEHIKTISVTTVEKVGVRKTKNGLIVMNLKNSVCLIDEWEWYRLIGKEVINKLCGFLIRMWIHPTVTSCAEETFHFFLDLTRVTETSWISCHYYWQPAPRWRLHWWLTKPENPALSSHTPDRTVTLINGGK